MPASNSRATVRSLVSVGSSRCAIPRGPQLRNGERVVGVDHEARKAQNPPPADDQVVQPRHVGPVGGDQKVGGAIDLYADEPPILAGERRVQVAKSTASVRAHL